MSTQEQERGELTQLLDCRCCGRSPKRGGVMFLGHHVECSSCGIAIPFPPAPTAEEAAAKWNEAQAI